MPKSSTPAAVIDAMVVEVRIAVSNAIMFVTVKEGERNRRREKVCVE